MTAGVGAATAGDFLGFLPRPAMRLILKISASDLKKQEHQRMSVKRPKCKHARIRSLSKGKRTYRSSMTMFSKAEELSSPLEKESLAWRRVLDFSFSRSFVLLDLEILDFFLPAEVAVPGAAFRFLAKGA